MAANTFKAAANWKPWWFTHEEIKHLDGVRAFRSIPKHVWDMKDATPSPEVDAIRVTCRDHNICLTKRMDMATWRPVYDIAIQGENTRTVKSFSALQSHFARSLQVHTNLDLVWDRIETQIRQENPAP